MTQACAACRTAAPGESRLKGVALLVGALLLCPCHLPLTVGALAAIGGLAWLSGKLALLYLLFGVTYLFIAYFGLRYIIRRRDEEKAQEAEHARHATATTS